MQSKLFCDFDFCYKAKKKDLYDYVTVQLTSKHVLVSRGQLHGQ